MVVMMSMVMMIIGDRVNGWSDGAGLVSRDGVPFDKGNTNCTKKKKTVLDPSTRNRAENPVEETGNRAIGKRKEKEEVVYTR